MRWTTACVWSVMVILGVVACSQPAPAARPGAAPQSGASQAPAASRTLNFVVRYETNVLAPKASAGIPARSTWRMFNASLTLVDADGVTRPYLADKVPELDTESWLVFPNGRMETTYKLKPNLTWHDGQPLTADDWAFAYQVYSAPGLGMFTSTPQSLMEGVDAPDATTLLIRWARPFPLAANMDVYDFDPLPRHILEAPFQTFLQDPAGQQDVFSHLPYWTTEYIQAGPYRLDRWEPGVQFEGTAFAGHALGKPKVERLILKIIGDENAVLSNLLSNNVSMAADYTLRYEHWAVLNRDWAARKEGVAALYPATTLYSIVQFRPEYQKSAPLLDLRVRQALAHTIDRDALNEGLYEGNGFMTESYVTKDARYFSELDRSLQKYPHDPRQAEQLMNSAGFTKDRDGFFANAAGERFRPDFWVEQGTLFERMLALMVENWNRAGFDPVPYVLPAAQLRDNQVRATFPGISSPSTGIGESYMSYFSSSAVGSPTNRWAGGNRGGYTDPEYDRLNDLFNTTLARSDRDAQVIAMSRQLSVNLPVFFITFNPGVVAHVSGLTGPQVPKPESMAQWNVHEWELK